MIRIQWLGHSCMKVDWDGTTVVFDPYADGSVPGYGALRTSADFVYCSHAHADHTARDLVTVRQGVRAPFMVREVPSFHDDVHGAKRGKNTIFVLDDGRNRIVHMGDIGHVLTKEQVEAIGKADIMMIPVGGYFTAEPDVICQILRQTDPDVVIPMHDRFGSFGYPVIHTLEPFEKCCDFYPFVRYDSDTFVLNGRAKRQAAVLRYERENR